MTKPQNPDLGADPFPDFTDPSFTPQPADAGDGILFDELAGSPRLIMSGGVLHGLRTFRVAWKNLYAFLSDLYGAAFFFGSNSSSQGDSLARFPQLKFLVATDYSAEPMPRNSPFGQGEVTDLTDTGGCNQYQYAKVDVTYLPFLSEVDEYSGPQMPDNQDGTLLTYTTESGSQYLSLPGRTFVWSGTTIPVPADITAGILLPTKDYVFHWHRAVTPDFSYMDNALGSVNDDTFMDMDAGTVLFTSYRPVPLFVPNERGGTALWNIEMKFKARAIPADDNRALGWNYAYRPDVNAMSASGKWVEIEDKASGLPPFGSVKFSDLFVYP